MVKYDNQGGFPKGACAKTCTNSSTTTCCTKNNCNFPVLPRKCYYAESLHSKVSVVECLNDAFYCQVFLYLLLVLINKDFETV